MTTLEHNIEMLKAMKDKLPDVLSNMSVYQKTEMLEELDQLRNRYELTTAQNKFIKFVKTMWPDFIEGYHHTKMAEAFEQVAAGKMKRLIVNMPPRHTKSEFASYLLPAWFLGKFPNKKIIQTSHTAELAVGFGRKVRNLVGSDEYKRVFLRFTCSLTLKQQDDGIRMSGVITLLLV